VRPSTAPGRGDAARLVAGAFSAALFASTFLGCSSGGDGAASTGSTSPVVNGMQALSPDGFAYPTPASGYGHATRRVTSGTAFVPGSVIQDFKFLGYPNADESKGLQTVSLVNYYDPCGKHLKVLHISVAAVWCVPCNQETSALIQGKSQLDVEGVVILQALSDGPTKNVGATETDLRYWIQITKTPFTEILDPDLANLGIFFDDAAIPFNADIDPRTMEIIDAATGWSGVVSSEVQGGLTAAAEMPGYPITAKCD
jgi:hypothetical protein